MMKFSIYLSNKKLSSGEWVYHSLKSHEMNICIGSKMNRQNILPQIDKHKQKLKHKFTL